MSPLSVNCFSIMPCTFAKEEQLRCAMQEWRILRREKRERGGGPSRHGSEFVLQRISARSGAFFIPTEVEPSEDEQQRSVPVPSSDMADVSDMYEET